MRRALAFSLVYSALACAPLGAFAQIRETCETIPETIVTLRKTASGHGSLWDVVYGQRGMERFETAVLLENGNVLAAGALYDRADPDDRRGLVVEMDRRGKVVRQNRHPGLGNLDIRKIILKEKGGFLAAGTKSLAPEGEGRPRRVVRLAHYGADLKLRSENLLSDPDYDLTLEGITVSTDGAGLVAAVSARGRAHPDEERGIVYRLTPDGGIVWKRSYDPGLGNRFTAVVPTADSLGNPGYIVTGMVRATDRRTVGLAMKLDADGRLMWQKQYPRGAGAILRAAASYGTGDVVVVGDSEPYGAKTLRSGWAMRLNGNNGSPVWQRYVAVSGARLYGRDAVAVPDGRASVLINAEGAGESEAGQDTARLLTLSPRGEILDDEGFTQGTGGSGASLVLGPRRLRLLTGHATMTPKGDDKSKPANYDTEDGWVVLASSLEPYTDPCLPRRAAAEDAE
jgi:hypothetical protein